MHGYTLGFLGAGNMAEALVKGLLASKVLPASRILASDARSERPRELAKAYGIVAAADNRELAEASDVIVLATKPQAIARVLGDVKPHLSKKPLVISIAAGVPLATIQEHLPDATRVVRVMPNTPALVLAGATGVTAGPHASAEDLALVRTLFAAVGSVVTVDEVQLDAVTGLSGSGPAYVFMVIEALADGGVRAGLPRDVALTLATQTVLGAAKLVAETGEHPACLKDKVTSPGGTTIAGLHALEQRAVRGAFIDAVEAATRRSRELGRATVSVITTAKPS